MSTSSHQLQPSGVHLGPIVSRTTHAGKWLSIREQVILENEGFKQWLHAQLTQNERQRLLHEQNAIMDEKQQRKPNTEQLGYRPLNVPAPNMKKNKAVHLVELSDFLNSINELLDKYNLNKGQKDTLNEIFQSEHFTRSVQTIPKAEHPVLSNSQRKAFSGFEVGGVLSTPVIRTLLIIEHLLIIIPEQHHLIEELADLSFNHFSPQPSAPRPDWTKYSLAEAPTPQSQAKEEPTHQSASMMPPRPHSPD